jgi:hypothetical protein
VTGRGTSGTTAITRAMFASHVGVDNPSCMRVTKLAVPKVFLVSKFVPFRLRKDLRPCREISFMLAFEGVVVTVTILAGGVGRYVRGLYPTKTWWRGWMP